LTLLLVFSIFSITPVAHAATVPGTLDCPSGTSAATSAASGNPGTGFSVTFSGTGPGLVTYSVVIPALSDLIEYCVYPNGGNPGTVTTGSGSCFKLSNQVAATSTLISQCSPDSSLPTTWKAGFNCGSYTCVEAQRATGTDTLFGANTYTVLDVTYTSALSSFLIVLHVSDEGSGVCSTSGVIGNPTTCFIIPSGGIFPPPPTTTTTFTSVPEFTGFAGMGFTVLLLALIPAVLLLRKRAISYR